MSQTWPANGDGTSIVALSDSRGDQWVFLADAIAGLHVDFDNRGGACDRLDGRRGLTLRKLYPALLDIDVVRAQANNLAKLNNMVNYRF